MRSFRFRLTLTVLVALSVSVAACSPGGSVPDPGKVNQPEAVADAATAVTFACSSGREVTVSYPDSTSIRVGYLGQAYTLAQVPAGAGAHYAGADLDWTSAVQNGREAAVLSRTDPAGASAAVVLERCARPVGTPAVMPIDAAPAAVVPSSAPPCRGPQLQLEDAGGDAAVGNRVAIVGVRNMGSQACSLTGYPSISPVDYRSQALDPRADGNRLGHLFSQRPDRVFCDPRAPGQAWFDVAWYVVPREAEGETACPAAARIGMTAPKDTSPVWLDRRLTPCGGVIRVTPFRAVAEPVPSPS